MQDEPVNYIRARTHLTTAAEHATAAYYVDGIASRKHHEQWLIQGMRNAAKVLGFELINSTDMETKTDAGP